MISIGRKKFNSCFSAFIFVTITSFDTLYQEITVQSLLKRFGLQNTDTTQLYHKQKKRIESDANYLSTIPQDLEEERKENTDLMRLVCDENGSSLYTPRKSALLIRPSNIKCDSGTMYQIKIAKKDILEPGDEYPVWHVDNDVVMLLQNNGRITLHDRAQAEQGRLTYLTHCSGEDYLDCPSLHPQTRCTIM